MEKCPFCGHAKVVTILKYDTNKPLKKELLTGMKKNWPLLFYRSTCRECNKSVVNKKFFCMDQRFNRYKLRMEYLFYFDGLLNGDSFSNLIQDETSHLAYHWKCKQCLRTWSEFAGHKDVAICPRCGMKSLVRITYGEPTSDVSESEERDELRLGGCIVDENNPKWVCLECDNHLFE
jgi:DNA-directed RNA polymerase subunit RPC12/RpoP